MLSFLLELAAHFLFRIAGIAAKEAVAPRARLEVQPTLRGLRVKQAMQATITKDAVYPWERVGMTDASPEGPCWCSYDSDGRPVKLNDVPVQLVLPDEEVNRTARRAYIRQFRSLWAQGKLACTENYEAALPKRPSVGNVAVFFAVLALFIAAFIRIWIFPRADMDRHVQLLLTGIFLLGLILFNGIPLLWFLNDRRSPSRLNVAQATFTSGGIAATLRDGSPVWYGWEKLKDLGGGTGQIRAGFGAGAVLYFNEQSRTSVILGVAAREHVQKIVEGDAQIARRGPKRAIVLAAIGLSVLVCVAYVEVAFGARLRDIITGAGFPIIALAAFLPVIVILRWAQRRLHRRERAKDRQAANRPQPLAR